jgi:hypothetical protein
LEEGEDSEVHELAKKEKERLKAIRDAQKKALEEMRKEQNRKVEEDQVELVYFG